MIPAAVAAGGAWPTGDHDTESKAAPASDAAQIDLFAKWRTADTTVSAVRVWALRTGILNKLVAPRLRAEP